MAAAVLMMGSLEQGLFGCCSSCHATAFGEELNSKTWASRERQNLLFGSRSIPLPAAVASARGGDERADWTPRAALASGPAGASPRTMMSTPPRSLLVDTPTTTRRSTTPPLTRDPAAKAQERARLRQLVNQFTTEAASGRPCTVIVLDTDTTNGNGVMRKDARYTLGDEVDRFMLLSRARPQSRDPEVVNNAEPEWETLGQWPLEAVLGTHRAEESALVASRQRELNELVSKEELGRAAVIEFGGGAFAGCVPLLLIEETRDHCERLVSSMQILRLYKGAAHRLESARNGGSRGSPGNPMMAGLWASVPASPDVGASSKNVQTPTTGGPSTPNPDSSPSNRGRPMVVGAVGNDDPVPDGISKAEWA